MSTHKKSRGKEDEAGEVFYRITTADSFQKHVAAIRVDFGIPRKAFSTSAKEERWFLSRTNDERRAFVHRLDTAATLFKLPPSLRTRLEEYVLGNGSFHIFTNRDTSTCELDHETADIEKFSTKSIGFTEELWRESGQPFVKIYVSDYANQADVKLFIQQRWKEIQRLLTLQRKQDKKRIRLIKDKKIKEEIYRLSKLTRSQLGCEKGEYTEQRIAGLIEKKFGEKLEFLNVRSIIQRRRKQARKDSLIRTSK